MKLNNRGEGMITATDPDFSCNKSKLCDKGQPSNRVLLLVGCDDDGFPSIWSMIKLSTNQRSLCIEIEISYRMISEKKCSKRLYIKVLCVLLIGKRKKRGGWAKSRCGIGGSRSSTTMHYT